MKEFIFSVFLVVVFTYVALFAGMCANDLYDRFARSYAAEVDAPRVDDLFVSPDGEGCECSSEKPCQVRVAHAYMHGRRVLVRPGRYREMFLGAGVVLPVQNGAVLASFERRGDISEIRNLSVPGIPVKDNQ